jgi:Xaa-Pro aminopeptidase
MTALPALAPIGYRGRIDRVRDRLNQQGLPPALLVTDPAEIRWCTGFGGSTAWLAICPDTAVLGTDYRYLDRAQAELAAAEVEDQIEVVVGRTRHDQHQMQLASFAGHVSVGASAQHLSHARWVELSAELPLQPVTAVIGELRRSKDEGELARISAACRFADAALALVAPSLGSGLTESQIRNELEYQMRCAGADGPSYDTIVASGPINAARPHHGAEQRRIEEGDLVVIDVGALVDGYHSDMTRSFVAGTPSAQQLDLYGLVLEAQSAGLGALGPGVPASEIDRACRAVFERAGYADWYLHASGHGVGLAIHEEPFHAASSTAELVVGDVVTVEPGLYRAGFGGIRIEDLAVVTDSGCRILTHTPKDTPWLPSPPTT